MNIHDPGVLEGIVGSTLGIIGGAIGVFASRRSARGPAKKPWSMTVAQYWTVAILLTVVYFVLLLTLQSQRVINFAGLLYMLVVISLSTTLRKKENKD